jgi:RecA-family ATPase
LLDTEYPPVTWVVPQMLPTGTAVLAGAPKAGKSLWALDVALSVAAGQDCLEQVGTRQGSVLYLSLDSDSFRRLSRRAKSLIAGRGMRRDLPMEFHTDWPTSEEGIRACIEWAEIEREEGRRPLLIVADTLTMIEPNWAGGARGQMGDSYSHTVRTLAPWAQMADEQDVCMMFVHHSRKGGSFETGGWQERILGSRGLAASTNTMLMLDMENDSDKGMLRYAGRDVGAKDLEIERDGLFWKCMDRPVTERHLSAVPANPDL